MKYDVFLNCKTITVFHMHSRIGNYIETKMQEQEEIKQHLAKKTRA